MLWQGLCWSVQIKTDVKNGKEFHEIISYSFLLFVLGLFYLVLLLPTATRIAKERRSFDDKLDLCLKRRMGIVLDEFSMHIPYHVHFLWKSMSSSLGIIATKQHYKFWPRPLMRSSSDPLLSNFSLTYCH